MKYSYTPGPWRNGMGYSVVAESDIGTHADQKNRDYYGGALVAESIKTEANQRLIAAAPDLLAALESLLNMEDWSSEDAIIPPGSPVGLARDAIAKARGA